MGGVLTWESIGKINGDTVEVLQPHSHAYNRTRLGYTIGGTVAGYVTLTVALQELHSSSQDNRLFEVA